jgi:hypothetical protein
MKVNTRIAEIAITYRCQNKCENCGTLCTQAPCNFGDLSVEEVERFIKETVDETHQWGLITITGGEPTLHADFEEICDLLAGYKEKYNSSMGLQVVTNGYGRMTETNIEYAKSKGIGIGLAYKAGRNSGLYVPVNDSPTDNGIPFTNGCNISNDCGPDFNFLGWYECTPTAAAARVFNYEPISKTLHGFLEKTKDKEYDPAHCKHCAHSWPGRKREFNQVTSVTWKKAFEEYKERYKI